MTATILQPHQGGTGNTAATGSGNVVLANSPTIVTPTIESMTSQNITTPSNGEFTVTIPLTSGHTAQFNYNVNSVDVLSGQFIFEDGSPYASVLSMNIANDVPGGQNLIAFGSITYDMGGLSSTLNSDNSATITIYAVNSAQTEVNSVVCNGVNVSLPIPTICSSSLLSISPTAGIGYGTGAGGSATQATSKSTGVTLNTVSGQITMNSAALPPATAVSFTLTNSSITTTDLVIVNIDSGATANSYIASIAAVGSGSCVIQLYNLGALTTLSEAVVLNFCVIKGVAS